jgi:hypothetical protein
MSLSSFNASVYISEQLNRQLVNMAEDLAVRCVRECGLRYGFDVDEAIGMLGLNNIKVERKASIKEKVVVAKVKPEFPLPFNGEMKDGCCYALCHNNGLYTQCNNSRQGDKSMPFCKRCAISMAKTGSEVPEYGTIQQRMEVGLLEFVDPKGRKPIAYTKVMKKYKITEEQVLAEAKKLNININPIHFVAPTEETKRGRPSIKKEPKAKGVKGRPKKSNKVVQIEGDDDDLFATLVANAVEDNSDEENEKAEKEVNEKEVKEKAKLEKKEAERLAREAKKAEEEAAKKLKEEQRLKEKAEKEAKLAAEKAAKEAAKAAKEAAKAAKEAAKANKKSGKKDEVDEEEEEPDVVKKIEFEGKKYLKSKKTGIVYDYNIYVKEGEQVVVGMWNESAKKIEFSKEDEDEDEEEEEEEYDM